ncbi:MAG: hypothetical protein ABIH42_09025, partial [Planctomycetota bacterium]
TFNTLQIPGNQPCIEEVMGLDGIDANNLVDKQITMLQNTEPNILSVHAEVEGGLYKNHFSQFVTKTLEAGYKYICLKDIANESKNAPSKNLTYITLPGRSGVVAAPHN